MQDKATTFEKFKTSVKKFAPSTAHSTIAVAFLRAYLKGTVHIEENDVADVLVIENVPYERVSDRMQHVKEAGLMDDPQWMAVRLDDILFTAGWSQASRLEALRGLGALDRTAFNAIFTSILSNSGEHTPPTEQQPQSAEVRAEQCETAIRNLLRAKTLSDEEVGLAPMHDKLRQLGYTHDEILGATYALERNGLVTTDHGTLRSLEFRCPEKIGDWQKMIFNLNVSKGWYEEQGLSERAAHILSRLPADEVSELLKHMPHADGKREAKGREDVATFCSNVTGELSELWEAYRAGALDKPCDKTAAMVAAGLPPLTCAEEELADVVIRVFDTAEFWGVDLERAMWLKHLYNATRKRRHGGKLA